MESNLYQHTEFDSYADYEALILAMDFSAGQRIWIDGSEPALICKVDKQAAEAVVKTLEGRVQVVPMRWITLHDPSVFGGWPTDNT